MQINDFLAGVPAAAIVLLGVALAGLLVGWTVAFTTRPNHSPVGLLILRHLSLLRFFRWLSFLPLFALIAMGSITLEARMVQGFWPTDPFGGEVNPSGQSVAQSDFPILWHLTLILTVAALISIVLYPIVAGFLYQRKKPSVLYCGAVYVVSYAAMFWVMYADPAGLRSWFTD